MGKMDIYDFDSMPLNKAGELVDSDRERKLKRALDL